MSSVGHGSSIIVQNLGPGISDSAEHSAFENQAPLWCQTATKFRHPHLLATPENLAQGYIAS